MRWLAASAKSLIILVIAGMLVFGSAHAAGTVVTAIVCSSAAESVITVNYPVSDSVVKTPHLKLVGKVTNAKQLNVSVDSIHRAALDIQTLDEPFQATLDLAEGTHEIKLESQNICGPKNGAMTLVVTYSPEAQPSQGRDIPTITQQNTTGSQPPPLFNEADGTLVTGLTSLKNDDFGTKLLRGVIDDSQPDKPADATHVIVALPFVVGAGAFGWVHIRRFRYTL